METALARAGDDEDAQLLASHDRSAQCHRNTVMPPALVSTAIMICLIFTAFVEVEQNVLRKNVYFYETLYGRWTLSCFIGPFTCGILYSNCMRIEQILEAHEDTNDQEVLISNARRCTLGDLLGSLNLVLLLGTILLSSVSVGNEKMLESEVVQYLLCYGYTLWAGNAGMRVSILQQQRLHIVAHIRHWKRQLQLTMAIQLVLFLFYMLFGATVGSTPMFNAELNHLILVHPPCLLINETYYAHYCSKTYPPPFYQSDGSDPTYTCDDGGLYYNYPSAYALCQSSRGYYDLVSAASFVLFPSLTLPMLLISFELRIGAGRGILRLLGDVAIGCTGLVLAFIIATGMVAFLNLNAFYKLLEGPLGSSYKMIFEVGWISPSAALIFYTLSSRTLRRRVLKLVGKGDPDVYACFLSHDWGTDGEGRNTHERVRFINDRLRNEGLETWFDSERMRGDINIAMTEGIDRSQTVVVFITKNYLKKAAGLGPRGLSDNCYAEFSYALNRRGVEKLIAVVMEPSCRDPSKWQGVVGLRLGSCLYIDCSMDALANQRGFDEAMEALMREVRTRSDPKGQQLQRGSIKGLASHIEMQDLGWNQSVAEEPRRDAYRDDLLREPNQVDARRGARAATVCSVGRLKYGRTDGGA